MTFKRYQLNDRVITDLKKRSTVGIVFYVVLAVLILTADGYYKRYPSFSGAFLFWISAICFFRFIHLPVSRTIGQRFSTLNTWLFLLSVAATGAIWGIGFAKFLMGEGEIRTRFMMTVCSIGLCSGGVVAFIPDLRLSVIFLALFLLPADLALFISGLDRPLAAALLLFFCYMAFVAVRGNREYWDALENEHLLKVRTRELEKISRIDGLTGLFNRRYFDQLLDQEWRRAARQQVPVSVILFDIDFFKQINDRYGHLAGDDYLKLFSSALQKIFRRTTDICARYGGEEFIVLMQEPADNAMKRAESLRRHIEETALRFDGKAIRTTISGGVASMIPSKKVPAEKLISLADAMLYRSKEQGRNRMTAARPAHR